jgi:hypothetical protein
MNEDPNEALLNDPTASEWLKWALLSALHRNPVDALNDVTVLTEQLECNVQRLYKDFTKIF